MAERPVVVLSLVERGWQAARECSLQMQRQHLRVVHLIKGSVDPEVLALVTPQPGIRLLSVPRCLFWAVVAILLAGLFVRGSLRAVLVDNEKSLTRLRRWVRRISADLLLVRSGDQGCELWDEDRRVSTVKPA